MTNIIASIDNNIAYIQATGVISSDSDFNAIRIRGLVDDYINKGIRDARIYISSKGGDVFEATEIDNELSRFNNVIIYVGSVAASAATYITSNPKFVVYCYPNSSLMIHKPMLSTSGNIDSVKSDIRLLDNVTNEYKRRYATKTGKTEQEIELLWSTGDYWMTALQAKEQKFVTDIVTESSTPKALTANIYAKHDDQLSWTLEDYLDKDPKAYEQMKRDNPVKATALENAYFGNNSYQSAQAQSIISPQSTIANRKNWTLEDYLDKDPKAYEQMKRDNPALASLLENAYFNKK